MIWSCKSGILDFWNFFEPEASDFLFCWRRTGGEIWRSDVIGQKIVLFTAQAMVFA